MRENRTSGSEGGAAQPNASSLPLSKGLSQVHKPQGVGSGLGIVETVNVGKEEGKATCMKCEGVGPNWMAEALDKPSLSG